MNQRSSHNWTVKPGGWDCLNTTLIDFEQDYPILSSIFEQVHFQSVINCNNYKLINENCLVSSFVDDYILERFWNNPVKYIHIFRNAKYVMSPDFSLMIGMPKPMQMWNIYRSRLVGYIWQNSGIKVIPTITWSDKKSFEYCFEGVERGSVVAVSNIGCRNEENKYYFDAGFEEMTKRIEPSVILFQCNKKHKEQYKDKRIVFLSSMWDNKRENTKNR